MRKKTFTSLKNNLGMTLIEILVVIGIIGVISAGIATLMSNLYKQQSNVSSKSDFLSLVNTVQSILNNTSSCIAAFGGIGNTTIGAFPYTVPTFALSTSDILSVGSKYGGKLEVSKLELQSKTASGGSNQYIVPLLLEVKKLENSSLGGQNLSHIFKVVMYVDPSNKITGCTGTYEEFWVEADSAANITYARTGNIGIGESAPAQKLDVNGNIQASAFLYRSDLRLKENIRTIPNALEKVLKLHGTIFKWKENDNSVDQLGLIAQEVEAVFPEAVQTNPHSGLKSVGYGNLIAPLIEAIKEQQLIINSQKTEIEEIKKQLKHSK